MGKHTTKAPQRELAADGMRFAVLTITPKMAAEWLDKKNGKNRTKKPRKIDAFARAMTLGRWRLTHQGIAFDENGDLLDGQNRLAACVKSNTAFRALVCFDEPRAHMAALDKGTVRNTSDTLTILRGEHVSGKAVAIARILLSLHSDTTDYFDDDEIDETIRKNRAEYEWLFGLPLWGQRLSYAPIAAALLYAHMVKPQQIDEFARLICEPENLPKHSPVYMAITLCTERRFRGGYGERMATFRRMLRCASGYCQAETMKLVRDCTQGLDYFQGLHALRAEEKASK